MNWYEVSFVMQIGEDKWRCNIDEHFERDVAEQVANDLYRNTAVDEVFIAAVVQRDRS